MTEAAIAALDGRITKLEQDIPSGFRRIETLIREEIQDLKKDQLSDIKAMIDRVERDVTKQVDRIADDQRRSWDAVRALESRENQRTGGSKAFGAITHFISAAIGGLITLLGTWIHYMGSH